MNPHDWVFSTGSRSAVPGCHSRATSRADIDTHATAHLLHRIARARAARPAPRPTQHAAARERPYATTICGSSRCSSESSPPAWRGRRRSSNRARWLSHSSRTPRLYLVHLRRRCVSYDVAGEIRRARNAPLPPAMAQLQQGVQ
jgi:hypothetical protein